MSVSRLKTIKVWIKGSWTDFNGHVYHAPHHLRLPNGADRWEVYEDPGHFKPIKFIAVADDGSVVAIHSYAHSEWNKWEGSSIES